MYRSRYYTKKEQLELRRKWAFIYEWSEEMFAATRESHKRKYIRDMNDQEKLFWFTSHGHEKIRFDHDWSYQPQDTSLDYYFKRDEEDFLKRYRVFIHE